MMPNGGPGFFPGPALAPQAYGGDAGMYASMPMMNPFGGGNAMPGGFGQPDASASGSVGYGGMQQQMQSQRPNSKYKTKLCERFMKSGICKEGVNCPFAHGPQELRLEQQQQQGAGGPAGFSLQQPQGDMIMEQLQHLNMGQQGGMPFMAQQGQMPPVHPAGARGPLPGPPPTGPPPPGSAPLGKGKPDVTYVDRVRALCGILQIGNAAELTEEKPAALQSALASLRSGMAFKETPFADSVEAHLPK